MELQLIHLSDLHFSKQSDPFEINIEKMIKAIISVGIADECVIVISGDLTFDGKNNEYYYVNSFVGALRKKLAEENYKEKRIEIVCVPGNHDIDFSKIGIDAETITRGYKDKNVDDLVGLYLDNMKGFFGCARNRKCFLDDKIVSKKVISYGDQTVGFVMLNTAPLSILGGTAEDMGKHYLNDLQLQKIEQATDADVNVLVMHHSIEWFNNLCKDRLRKIISRNYSLVLTGHEHVPVGESRNINGSGEVQCVQGNAMYGNVTEGNGFCTVNIDLDKGRIVGHSCLWKKSLYITKKIIDGCIKNNFGGNLMIQSDFIEEISKDSDKRNVDDYYVFPSLTYNVYKENEDVEKHDVETEKELIEAVSKYSKVVITGEHKSGKTLLANKLYRTFLNQKKVPLLITASDVNKRKMEKTIEYAFFEQYEDEDNAYDLFKQMDNSDKIVLLDEANLIPEKTLKLLLEVFDSYFGKIIIFTEEKLELDIKKQVVDIMVEADTLYLTIKPFLYVKRKKLINNILSCRMNDDFDVEKETKKINELINTQVKYFNLNPEFIISFVNQYEKSYRFEFSSGLNVFNIVYESSIRNRIIDCSENYDVTTVINVLRELAFYMHFGKKNCVNADEINGVVEKYNLTYRQNVNVRLFLGVAIKAKIIVEFDNEYRFKDHTIVAYFVAQALNRKYNQGDDIKNKLDYLLENLCFGINSDIVLFLALITDNPKFLYIIIDGAKKHFEGQEELSFDVGNVKFLLDTTIPVKDTLPSEEERMQREKEITKQEEDVKISDFIELVNEYDYSEEDLLKVENQIMISFKYLEILSKALPAFCQNMKVDQQDELVALIYRCPNQFLFTILKDIGDNFEIFCNEVYDDISALRREKNIAEVNINSVKHMVEQISAVLVMALYQIVASTCASEQTITALNEFSFGNNSNYKLQNLMMASRVIDVSRFSKQAQDLNKEMNNKIEKSIIKYTVREYLLRNNVEVYGEAQSLIDCFFGGKSSHDLKIEIAKRRITDKDRT